MASHPAAYQVRRGFPAPGRRAAVRWRACSRRVGSWFPGNGCYSEAL